MKKPSVRQWYRVEFSLNGKVRSIRAVSRTSVMNPLVVYVLAEDRGAASLAAFRKRQRVALQRRRLEYREQGLCRCGREREDEQYTRCRTCRVRSRRYQRDSDARATGKPVVVPSKSEAFRQRKLEDELSARLRALREVYELWQHCSTNGEFTRRLKAAIAEAEGKKAAA